MHDDDNEIKLRAHIRENLLDYAHEHLTVDHVQYLQSAVSQQLTKMLKQIPTHEPGHLALPVDPLETLKTRLKLGSLPAYDEALELDADVMEYIKKSLVFKGKVRTERLWEEEDEVDYSSRLHRPMTPIVSRSSKKKTPQLGRKSTEDASLAASLPSYITKRIPDEGMPERKHENLHDLMDVKLAVDAETRTKLTTYRQLTPFLSRANKTYPHPKHIDAFLRSQSPPPDQRFTLMSPPIFARDRRARQTGRDSDAENEKAFNFIPLNSVEVAAKLGQTVDVDDIDPDIADANMVVVDGWATLASSASSGRGTPSLSSGISEVDELDDDPDLWRPSSEAVPASIELWHDAKMEEPIFPRAERPRCGKTNKVGSLPDDGQSFSSFMSAHLPADSNAAVRILTAVKSDDDALTRARTRPSSPPMTAVSLSMLGQPPSESEMSSEQANESDAKGDTFDRDVRRALNIQKETSCVSVTPYHDVIMREQLDEKEGMFMNVPALPPPNAYLKSGPQTKEAIIVGLRKPMELKKVLGLKSLNLELSWRPFTFGAKIPTHAELVGTRSPPSFGSGIEHEEDQGAVNAFLASSIFTPNADSDKISPPSTSWDSNSKDTGPGLRFLKDLHADMDDASLNARFDPRKDFDDDQLLILTRAERQAPQYDQHYTHDDALSNEILSFGNSYETANTSSALSLDPDSQLVTPDNTHLFNGFSLPDDIMHSDVRIDKDDIAHDNYGESEGMDVVREWKRRRLLKTDIDVHYLTGNALAEWNGHDTGDNGVSTKPLVLTVDPKNLILADETHALPQAPLQSTLYVEDVLFPSRSQYNSEDIDMHNPDLINSTGCFAPREDRECDVADDIYYPEAPLSHPEIGPVHQITGLDHHLLEQTDHAAERPSNTNPPKTYLPSTLALLCGRQSLSSFIQLRGKKVSVAEPLSSQPNSLSEQIALNTIAQTDASAQAQNQDLLSQAYRSAPLDLLAETRAFTIPNNWKPSSAEHTYIVSLDFIQQRGLVRALESCSAVHLVERDSVMPSNPVLSSDPNKQHSADVSLIVGPHSAVVFFPLAALPTQTVYTALFTALSAYSWRFSNILLVLLAFPRSRLFRAPDLGNGVQTQQLEGPYVYSPPVLKAARRIRRDLALRDGTNEKRAECTVELAFADGVGEAAMFVREFSELALKESVVDYAPYIGEDEQEGERDLTDVEGMNAFCAAIILRCCTIEEFLEMTPERRTEGFADLIGKERIEHVNAVLSERMQVMDTSLPSSSDFLSSLDE